MDCEEVEGMRIRTVKEDFWKSETMASVEPFSRLMAIALLNFADDKGFFILNIPVIRGALFPFEEDSMNVRGAVQDLSRIGYLRTGKSEDGKEIGHIVNFSKHQRIDKPQASKLEGLEVEWIIFQDHSKNAPGAFPVGMERKGMERKGKGSFSAEAEELYLAYPKKAAPDKAKVAIEKALKRVEFPVLLEAVQAYAKSRDGQDPTFTKHPQGWFNDSRWLDDRSTWLPKDGAAGAAPTPSIHEWMHEGQAIATSSTTRNGATWPRDLCSAAYYQCSSSSWRGITDWRGKLRAECLRWVGNENGRAR